MIFRFELVRVDDLTEEQRAGIKAMKEVVYPPSLFADAPIRGREWKPPSWAVLVTDDDRVVSYTGIVLTDGLVDGREARIGGVGGVATHPDQRGRGLARRSIELALGFMSEQGVDFALLVCREELIPYYTEIGWRRFNGTMLVTQFGEQEEFTFNLVMVADVLSAAPDEGVVDLLGPPW